MRQSGLPAGRPPAEVKEEGTGFEMGLAQPQILALVLRCVALAKRFCLSGTQFSVVRVEEMVFVKHGTLPRS